MEQYSGAHRHLNPTRRGLAEDWPSTRVSDAHVVCLICLHHMIACVQVASIKETNRGLGYGAVHPMFKCGESELNPRSHIKGANTMLHDDPSSGAAEGGGILEFSFRPAQLNRGHQILGESLLQTRTENVIKDNIQHQLLTSTRVRTHMYTQVHTRLCMCTIYTQIYVCTYMHSQVHSCTYKCKETPKHKRAHLLTRL